MTSYTFICDKCGRCEDVEDPIKPLVNCGCGGVLRLAQGVGRRPSMEVPVVNPRDEPTSIMGLVVDKPRKKTDLSELFRFKAVMCPHCGWVQVTEGKTRFKCRSCNRSSSYRKRGGWNVKLYDFPTGEKAMIYAKKWKARNAGVEDDS